MTINKHLTKYADYPVISYDPTKGIQQVNVLYRVYTEYDEDFIVYESKEDSKDPSFLQKLFGGNKPAESTQQPAKPEERVWVRKFKHFLSQPNVEQTSGFVVGSWMGDDFETGSADIIAALTEAAPKLPNVHALFVGDVTFEESEISWLIQSDMSSLFAAYPKLTHFGARGGNQLGFETLSHATLKELIIETGGLNRETTHDILRGNLPELTHLELYIGTEEYGRSTELDDLAPLLSGSLFPKLKYLGLRNAEIADDIATAIVNSPLLERIDILDLSLGTLTDIGGNALLNSERILGLKKLDLNHHFLSDDVITKLSQLPIEVDVSDKQDDDDGEWRFVAIGE